MAKNKIIYSVGIVLALIIAAEAGFYSSHGHLWPSLFYPGDDVARSFYATQTGGSSLLAAECADRGYINNVSDYIIEGRVDSAGNAVRAREGIQTYTGIKIDKYAKGTAPDAAGNPGNMLTLITPGGCIAGICQATEDQPSFGIGKKIRIYLKNTNGEYNIVCGNMGVEEIVN